MKILLAAWKFNRILPVLILFVGLAFFYSVIIPIFEGPDEDDHVRYAKYLADHRTFPVQRFAPGGGIAGHQGWQPPLYYSLVALVIAPLDTSDYEQQLWRNPAATFVGDPACCGRNLYYHPDAQNFPWSRTTLAVHLARLLSIFFGAVTVWTTYRIAYALSATIAPWGGAPWDFGLATATASVVAFNPSFLFASALVSNDAPLAALATLVILIWVEWLTGRRQPTWKSIALLGTLLGVALLIKTTALGLIPFSLAVILIVAWRARAARIAVIGTVGMLAVSALISGWWFVRNQILYGDPLAYRLMLTSAIFPRAGELTLPELFQISLPWLWQTFWGGPTPGDFSPVLLIALAILALCAAVGMLLFTLHNALFAIRSSIIVLGAWLAFILIAQIQFIRTTTGADQGRYLFPAISVIALFFVFGLRTFAFYLSRRVHLPHFGALAPWLIGAFLALAFYVPLAYTLPAYARPPLLTSTDLARLAHPVHAIFAEQFELVGFDLDARSLTPGETLRIALYWRARAPMSESYRIFVHLVGQANRLAGGVDVIPARGAFPTVYWKPGDILRDVVQVPIKPEALPGKYTIEIGAYPVGKPSERVVVTSSNDDRVIVGAIKVAPREKIAYNPRTQVNANFGDEIELVGYDAAIESETLHLILYWRARNTIALDYQVFVHLLDANGNIVTQSDQEPQAGNYPTSLWDKGEWVRDEYVLWLPAGSTQVVVGWYRLDTQERLPILDANGNILRDHLSFELAGVNR